MRGMGDWSRPRESSLREERRCQKPSSTKLWNGSNWRIRPDPLSDDEEEEEEDTTEDEEAIALPPIDPRSRSILSSPPLCSLRRQRIIYYKRNTSLEEKESKNTFSTDRTRTHFTYLVLIRGDRRRVLLGSTCYRTHSSHEKPIW